MERLIQIVNAELLADRLKAEEELEWLINATNIDVETKVARIKKVLGLIVNHNQMATMWLAYTNTTPKSEEK
jgi:hypothetical protein